MSVFRWPAGFTADWAFTLLEGFGFDELFSTLVKNDVLFEDPRCFTLDADWWLW